LFLLSVIISIRAINADDIAVRLEHEQKFVFSPLFICKKAINADDFAVSLEQE